MSKVDITLKQRPTEMDATSLADRLAELPDGVFERTVKAAKQISKGASVGIANILGEMDARAFSITVKAAKSMRQTERILEKMK